MVVVVVAAAVEVAARSAWAGLVDGTQQCWRVDLDTEVVVVTAGSVASCSDRRNKALSARLFVLEVAADKLLDLVPSLDGSRVSM